jgi:hypothetical protein
MSLLKLFLFVILYSLLGLFVVMVLVFLSEVYHISYWVVLVPMIVIAFYAEWRSQQRLKALREQDDTNR